MGNRGPETVRKNNDFNTELTFSTDDSNNTK